MKQQLVRSYAETPPVRLPRISLLPDDLWGHVGHATRNTCMQPAVRVMDGNVEICKMGMSTEVEKDVIRLYISVVVEGELGRDNCGYWRTGVLSAVYEGTPGQMTILRPKI